MRPVVLAFVLAGSLPVCAAAQAPARPRPYPVFETREFQRAVERGTRTRTGRPGANYWQQKAEYRLQAALDPATKRLQGEAEVRYHNRSPDTLRVVVFHLYQNLFAPDGVRNEPVPVTGGTTLHRVVAQGRELAAGGGAEPGWSVDATRLRVRLPEPLVPGASADFAFRWSFTVAPDGAPRGGTDGEVFFLSYWYPQVAVYDDVTGWQADPYMSNAEFYMGYGDYDVALTVPEGWLIGATGALQNPEEVLGPAVRLRLREAASGAGVVPVVSDADRGAGTATARGAGGTLTWRFRAENVRDFAFGTSDQYLWDATTASVGRLADGQPERRMIHTFYRPSRRAWAWDQSARYARHSIEFLSGYLWRYPYPQATAVDGVTSCAGMEYPMITCIGGPRDTLALYSVTVHELAHMWFPMQVGSDEKRFAWQDEGLTRYNQAQGMRDFFRGYQRETITRDSYLRLARDGGEVELMRHGDLYPYGAPAYGVATYDKMATNVVSLRGLV
ncbi:MAG TPA: M1 family metallopeptidase, partial [Gemmatimonadales bacterium]